MLPEGEAPNGQYARNLLLAGMDAALSRAEKGQERMAAYERRMYNKPEDNRFLLWSHENLANFAKDVLAQNSQLRERLAQIRELAK